MPGSPHSGLALDSRPDGQDSVWARERSELWRAPELLSGEEHGVVQAHEHDHVEDASVRPKGARLDPPDTALQLRAALAGRLDVLSPKGVLGLQRVVGNGGATAMLAEERSPVHDVVGSPGASLDPEVRADMEARLGHDFSDVRVHTDGAAESSARAVGAHAYTVGSHIAFQRSAYDPSSHAGRTTLAHELTHVVQQRNGPVDGTPAPGGVSVSDPGDRFERDAVATAERAMTQPTSMQAATTGTAPPVPHVQREEEPEEEEPVQGSFVQRADVQREEEPEEEPEG